MDEKPSEDYSDIGGLDKQIQELVEAIVLPVTHKVPLRTFLLHALHAPAQALSLTCCPARGAVRACLAAAGVRLVRDTRMLLLLLHA